MKKSIQNNRSALLTAGQNSLSHIWPDNPNYIDNQNLLYKNQNKNLKNAYITNQNNLLYQSNVKQIYKRQSKKQIDNLRFQQQKSNIKAFNKMNSKSQYQISSLKKQISSLELQNKNYNPSILKNGERSLIQNQYSPKIYYNPFNEAQLKKLMMRLTLVRLRKMQALVRGFLVRRKIYPKLLQQYLIAKSVQELIEANVIYKQISTIIMQTITFPKYQNQENINDLYKGHERQIQQAIYDLIVTRIIRKQLQPVIQESIINKGLLLSRPQITYGFNLRDPLQLLLYERLMKYLNYQLKIICEDSIRQQAQQKRQLFIVTSWIQKHDMLRSLYQQIINQSLEENIGEYIVVDIINNLTKQAAYVIANGQYNKTVNEWYQKIINQMKQQIQQLILEEAIGQAMIEMKYGVEKVQYLPNQIIQSIPLPLSHQIDKKLNLSKISQYNRINNQSPRQQGQKSNRSHKKTSRSYQKYSNDDQK